MAFLQQSTPQPFLRVPAATVGLLAVLILAHVGRVLAPASVSQAIILNYAFYPARYSHAFLAAHGVGPQTLWDRAVPFVSYIFIHANFTHLFINCMWLLPFGTVAARRYGTLTFYCFFLVCGVAGALAYLAANWGSMSFAVGASAAISGMMGATFRIIAPLLNAPANGAVQGREMRSPPPLEPIFSSRIALWSLVWIAINIVAGVTGLGAGPGVQLIAWQAHIGGYLAGLLLAGPFDAMARRLGATSG